MKKLLLFSTLLCATTIVAWAQKLTVQPTMTNYYRSDYKNTSDGSIAFVSCQSFSYLTKKDNNGDLVFTKKTNFYDFVQHTDGSIIYIYNKYINNQSFIYVVRENASGNVLWTKEITSTSDIAANKIVINDAGQIFVAVSKVVNMSSTGYYDSAILGFDLNGQNNFTTHFNDGSLNIENDFRKLIIAQNGDLVGLLDIMGSANNQKCGIGLIRMTPTGAVTVSKFWNFQTDYTRLSINGLVETPAGDFIFGARLMENQLTSFDDKIWLCKTNSSGAEMLQRTFSAGPNSAEKLNGLLYTNNSLYAFMRLFRNGSYPLGENNLPVIAKINSDSLHVESIVALNIPQLDEDPYGNTSTAFGIAHNGNIVAVGGMSCLASGISMPYQMEVSPALLSSCSTLEKIVVFTDSLTTYPNSALTHSGSFTLTLAAGTNLVTFTDTAAFPEQDLCLGCADVTQISEETASSSLKTYPNPVSKNLHFTEPNAQNKGKYNIVAHSVLGQKVYESSNMEMPISIDVSDFTNGFYIFTLTNLQNHQQTQQRVIKN